MLKSTYKPQQSTAATLPLLLAPGWTEHTAPTGHQYYYNAETKQSTYTRPIALPQIGSASNFSTAFNPSGHEDATESHLHSSHQDFHRGRGGSRGGAHHQDRKRQQEDGPKRRYVLTEYPPWILVKTKMGRRFVYNSETNESFWRFPEDVLKAVVDFDIAEMRKKDRKANGDGSGQEDTTIPLEDTAPVEGPSRPAAPATPASVAEGQAKDDDLSEYEEVEVTDDEGEDDGNPSKRQRTEGEAEDQPVNFDEDDIAFQLQAMGQDYGLDPGEYGAGEGEEWEEGAEGLPLSEEDSKALFRDLLNDFNINPYSTWEKLIEDGYIIEDDRYTVLPNMKARRECWTEWSRERMQLLKEQREKQVKKDPRIPYMAFLQDKATPKLYWPEFKRKFRKEPELRDTKVTDKDREKLYREHIKRIQLPQSTLKSDLSTLLKSFPVLSLNRSTSVTALPTKILTDIRYISLSPDLRDPLIEAYLSTLPPAPEGASVLSAEEEAEAKSQRKERKRRENALAEREKRVEEEKRKQKRDQQFGRERLREEERELQRAMDVGRQGLKGQLQGLESNADVEAVEK